MANAQRLGGILGDLIILAREEIEESGVAAVGAGDAGGDTTPGEENVLGIVRSDASGAVCFRERFAGN